jgi:TolB-like protein
MASRLSAFFSELKRRKVYHVAGIYVAVGFVVWQVADFAVPAMRLPEEVSSVILLLTLLGLPVALVLAWAYEVRPEEPKPSGLSESETPSPPASAPQIPVSAAEQRKSIVVLPFDNMSPDPGDAFFADGLTEENISKLSRLEYLRVISRSSAVVLKASLKDIRAIGKEMDVGFVLEGSVRKVRDDLRITAQLIDAESDAHVWAETYEGVFDDVFGIQEKVSKAIVEALNLKLTVGEKEELSVHPVQDPRAYECYLKAWHDLNLGSKESYQRAIKTLKAGIELYGEDPLLLATLGTVYFWQIDVGIETDPALLDRARQLAERALSLDPGLPHGKSLLANLERRGGNLTTCARLAMEAHRADPNDPGILLLAAMFAGWYVGQYGVAKALFDRLFTIDPLTPINHLIAGVLYAETPDRQAVGLEYLQKARDMGLELPWTRMWVGYALWMNGKAQEAIEELEDALAEGLPDPTAPMTRFLLGAFRGDREEALAALDPSTEDYAWNDPDFPFLCAGIFALLGETEQSLRWAQHGVSRGLINYPIFASYHPFFEPVRSDPRFQGLLAEIKPKWEAFHY